VEESLRRFERGLAPVADLDDLLAAMRVIDSAYVASGWRPKPNMERYAGT
jgi:hypothetical protein